MMVLIPSAIDEAGRCIELARLFEALSDPVRLRILRSLYRDGEHYVAELCEITGKRQQAISHHLVILKLQGIIAYDRRQKSNYYRLTPRGRPAVAVAADLAVA